MELRWRNKRCTNEGLELMIAAVRKVETDVQEAIKQNGTSEIQVPTALNDALSPNCTCVAVVPNLDEACCFRGMECAQFDVICGSAPKVYNVAILRKNAAVGASRRRE